MIKNLWLLAKQIIRLAKQRRTNMTNTQKKHWVNGYQNRSGWHNTITMSLFGFGLMIAFGINPYNDNKRFVQIESFKLI